MKDSPNSKINNPQESTRDLTLAWRLFRDNWRAFNGCFLFAVLALIIFVLVIISVFLIVLGNDSVLQWLDAHQIILLIAGILTTVITLIGVILFLAFLNAQYGLAYDVMSSGDGFAEFKGAFTYFKRFWWQYPLLTLLLTGGGIVVARFQIIIQSKVGGASEFPVVLILSGAVMVFYFVWLMLWNQTFPSLTAQGSIKRAFQESITIFRNHFPRVARSIGLYCLIFFLPVYLNTISTTWVQTQYGEIPLFYSLLVLNVLLLLILWFIGVPMMALISTRIYNSVTLKFPSLQDVAKSSNSISKSSVIEGSKTNQPLKKEFDDAEK